MKKEMKHILKAQEDIGYLSGVSALLDWDEKTFMPENGISARGEQTRIINSIIHEKTIDPKLYSSLRQLQKGKLNKHDQLIVNELNKNISKIRRLPKQLVDDLSRATVNASALWQKARKKNNFNLFKPALKGVIALKKKQAKYLNPTLSPYDSLLNEHEEGLRSEKVTELFEYLKKELVILLNDIKGSPAFKQINRPKIRANEISQETLCRDIITRMGLKRDQVAFNKSAHPFTIRIAANDIRITTRYTDPLEAFLAAVHEAGHALYELNLPKAFENTVIYDAASFGLHESQSRFWENMVCRSQEFWKGYFAILKKQFGVQGNWQGFYKRLNVVKPSFIRVNADEVTYALHIVLRYEIERDLISGKLKVDKAKEVWNRKFREMFGITPPSDNYGILQDVHWSFGAFGYFPTYAIGTIYASQIFDALKCSYPDLSTQISQLQFKKITSWLKRNIHSKGKSMLAEEIIRSACKHGLNPQVFVKYLRSKYSKIYNFG